MAKGKFEYWLTEEGLLRIGAWARDGLTDEQIAHNIGIARQTLNEWKNRFPSISDTLKKNKEVADVQVENALFKRAIGFEYTEEKTIVSAKDGVRTETTIKQVVPDTTAAIFWLKNRKPDVWRDRKDIVIEGTINTDTSQLSDSELDEQINKIKKQLGISEDEEKG